MPCTVLAMYVESVSMPVAANTDNTSSGGREGGKEEQRAFATERLHIILYNLGGRRERERD